MAKLTAVLYDNNLANPSVVIPNLMGKKLSGLRFGTVLPGGFGDASFSWPCSWPEAWDWYESYYNYQLTIHEGVSTIWQGRLEDIELSPSGITPTFMGYWRSCYDEVFNDVTNYISGTAYAGDIIRDVLEDHCPQVHKGDFSHLRETYFNLCPITFTDNNRPGDAFQRLGAIGDGSQSEVPWYFAIWEGRVPYFLPKPKDFSEPDWHVFKRDLAAESGYSLRRSLGEMANRVAMIYSTYDGMRVITDYAEDADSIAKWNLTREIANSMGEGGTLTAASARDAYLKDHANPPQSATIQITSRIRDKNGKMRDLWHVRAGDVLRIDDLIPEEDVITKPQLDQMRTFFIKETDFDLDSYTLTVTPEMPGTRAEVALARADLGARW